jgi:hypothetical protein
LTRSGRVFTRLERTAYKAMALQGLLKLNAQKVFNAQTQMLMVEYYRRLLNGEGGSAALCEA